MAQQVHFAKASLKALDLTTVGSGIEVTVHYDSGPSLDKVGTLKIGYGGLHWKSDQKHKTKRLSWSDLDRLMD